MAPRPINLALWTIRFPITAIVSIGHRISGVWVFMCLPFLLWSWQGSLHSSGSFSEVSQLLDNLWFKGLWLSALAALVYHWIAGVRHLLMDLGLGESKCGGKAGAVFVLVAFVVAVGFMGACLW